MNQLFRHEPDNNIMSKLLSCFNLKGINDTTEFTKKKLINFNTIDKVTFLIPELIMYYVPCKSIYFLKEINVNRCVTILNHFVKFFKYKIKRRPIIEKTKKILFYSIISLIDKTKCKVVNLPILIDFK